MFDVFFFKKNENLENVNVYERRVRHIIFAQGGVFLFFFFFFFFFQRIGVWAVSDVHVLVYFMFSVVYNKKEKRKKGYSGVHPRVSTLIQPSFQKREKADKENSKK